jgi:hypothetical protein
MAGMSRRAAMVTAGVIGVALLTPAAVATQEQFQFVVSARDADGHPVIDLKAEEVVMSENGVTNQIVRIEPLHMPVKVTIAIDNGITSGDALSSSRSGLEGLVRALPPEVEIAVYAMAPQPRMVQGFTADHARAIKGINAVAPEQATPRFIDTLVEFSKRLRDELNKTKRVDSLPVLVMVSTRAPENSSYKAEELSGAVQFLEARKTRAYITTTTTSNSGNQGSGTQPDIAIPLAKATRGRYEGLANNSRLATLLPEFGTEIAALHRQHYNQFLVTAQRAGGPLQNPRIELTRPNITGLVSVDGLP